MFTLIRVAFQPADGTGLQYQLCAVNNRQVLARFNRRQMQVYLAGRLHLLPNQVTDWRKAPPVRFDGACLLRLLQADGFVRHNGPGGEMLLRYPPEGGVYSFRLAEVMAYDSNRQATVDGLYMTSGDDGLWPCRVSVSIRGCHPEQAQLVWTMDVEEA